MEELHPLGGRPGADPFVFVAGIFRDSADTRTARCADGGIERDVEAKYCVDEIGWRCPFDSPLESVIQGRLNYRCDLISHTEDPL